MNHDDTEAALEARHEKDARRPSPPPPTSQRRAPPQRSKIESGAVWLGDEHVELLPDKDADEPATSSQTRGGTDEAPRYDDTQRIWCER